MRVDGRRRNSRPGGDLLRERILGVATEIVRRDGLSALTLPAIGRVLHMRPETIQRFVRDLDEVRDVVTASAQAELAELVDGAIGGRRGRPALEALFESQRLYAQAQPGMYEAALLRPPGARGAGVSEQDALTRAECAALRACGVSEAHAEGLAWCCRAAVHGAISLEASDRRSRQQQIDENFDRLVSILDAAARSTAQGAAGPPPWVVSEARAPGRN
ncbi:MAG TPA: TetR-like C-terminal domain-containing protein [Phenylobacterium sp.]|jgi:AcrR family transcriptional regulator|uniref:TetR-like C-terminal domain-containing protein n=1 Tax=Phenylobacterium sp. TaxID=1871053 RepID=UPI002D039870|nr:TetR-like C-terminal domain-containing protein [Phenylobacterium sp.]HXA39371.1 TetR-like C-terminal domain-containing protein [Phenylobacterium sp.]